MKVSVDGEIDVSVPSAEEMSITTLDVGSVFKTTVKVSVVPVSETAVDPPVAVIVIPALSSSVVVTTTVCEPSAS